MYLQYNDGWIRLLLDTLVMQSLEFLSILMCSVVWIYFGFILFWMQWELLWSLALQTSMSGYDKITAGRGVRNRFATIRASRDKTFGTLSASIQHSYFNTQRKVVHYLFWWELFHVYGGKYTLENYRGQVYLFLWSKKQYSVVQCCFSEHLQVCRWITLSIIQL